MKVPGWVVFTWVALFLAAGSLPAAGVSRGKLKAGRAAFEQGRWDEALNHFQEALLDDPTNPLLHFNLADALYKKQRYEESVKEFEKALSTSDPRLQEQAYYNLGNAYYQLQLYQQSIQAYKKALELDPNDLDAKHNLELVRAKLKEMAQKHQQNPSAQQNQQQQQQAQDQQQKQDGKGDNEQQHARRGQQQEKGEQNQQQQPREQKQQKQSPAQQQSEQKEGQQAGVEKKPLSKEEAERILQALRSKEIQNKNLKHMVHRSGRVHVEKDW